MNADQYVRMLQGLLPRGDAWSRDQDSTWTALFTAMAQEMVRMDSRAGVDMLNEAIPSTANELLPDWERVCGITNPQPTVPLRRAAIVQALSNRGGQSPGFFIGLAFLLGFTVTISTFRPFEAGRSVAGDALTNGGWVYTWRVNGPLNTVTYFLAGQNSAGDALAVWGNTSLETAIKRFQPAHTILQFSYS